MEDVNLNQLKTVCNLYLEIEFPYFEELREAFYLLDICGCRIEELFEINRWAFVDGNTVTLQPQKNNLVRTITLNEYTQTFRQCVISQTKPFLGRTSHQLQYLFRKLNPYIPIYSGGREISLYCYRYKHIWEAQAAGLTVEQIRIEMGHRTQTPILLYLAAQITSTYYIEPYNPDPYPEGHIDILTDEYYFNGTSNYFNIVNPINSNQFSVLFDYYNINHLSCCILSSANADILKNFPEIMGYYGAEQQYITSSYKANRFNPPSTVKSDNLPVIYNRYLITFNFVLTAPPSYQYGLIEIKSYCNPTTPISKTTYYTSWREFNTESICIGARGRNNNVYEYKAAFFLKNLKIWNRILSQDEINSLF